MKVKFIGINWKIYWFGYENYNLLLDINCIVRNIYIGKLFLKWWDEFNMNDVNNWLRSMKIDFY